MQKEVSINRHNLSLLIDEIFVLGEPQVTEDYSKYGAELTEFQTSDELKAFVEQSFASGERFCNAAIYYPETAGHIETERIKLDPNKCSGHTFRFRRHGWGVIALQLDSTDAPTFKCRIAVNSEQRASAWHESYPQLRSPDLWNWRLVERNARRLIGKLSEFSVD